MISPLAPLSGECLEVSPLGLAGPRKRRMCISSHCMQGETAHRNFSMEFLHDRHILGLPLEGGYHA